jgi:hypothetical protein
VSDEAGKDTLLEVLLSAIDLSKRVGSVCNVFPRPIEVLIDMVIEGLSAAQSKPFQISFHPRIFQSSLVLGSIENYGDRADVFYDLDRNACWRRFIVAKEMCHLLFAPHGAKHLASTPHQIEQLITHILAGLSKVDYTKDHAASTETSTIFLALEVLLPHSERENISKDTPSIDIATKYRIPEAIVRVYMTPFYIEMMNHAYGLAGRK